jgi:predicted regulator of Ras-like GTPase activity (Roadblock/LC7/MglB family)
VTWGLSFLEELLAATRGAEAALLLDAQGEVVVEAGQRQERHRLIGAYQGLALTEVRGAVERCGTGALDYVMRRHAGGSVILRPLKDGYYLVVALMPEAPISLAVYESARLQERLNEEL